MKPVAYLLALACATTLAHAETPEHYHYGMHLDIAKVISQTLPQGCEAGKPAWSTWTPRANSTR